MILSALNIVSFLCDQVFLSLFVYLDQPAHCIRVRLVGLPLLVPAILFDENCACGEKKSKCVRGMQVLL